MFFLTCKLPNGKTYRQLLNGLKTFETKTMHHSFIIIESYQYNTSYFIKQLTMLKLSVLSLIKIFPSLCNVDECCYSIIKNLDWKNLVMKTLMSHGMFWWCWSLRVSWCSHSAFVKNCYEKRERWLVPWQWTRHYKILQVLKSRERENK